jgi:hypothetical protein
MSKGLEGALWQMCADNIAQGRHHETQRTAVTNLVLAVSAGVLGLITFDKAINTADLPLTIFLIFLGSFGAVFCARHYERFDLHMARARWYRDAADQLLPDFNVVFPKTSSFAIALDKQLAGLDTQPTKPLKALKAAGDQQNAVSHRVLDHHRLHSFWIGFNLLISALGVVLTVWAVFWPQKGCP